MKKTIKAKHPVDEYQLLKYILMSSKNKHISYILKRLNNLKKMAMQHA